jgi:hypothetical protein
MCVHKYKKFEIILRKYRDCHLFKYTAYIDIYNYNSVYAVKKKENNFTVSSQKYFLPAFISSPIHYQNDTEKYKLRMIEINRIIVYL